MPALETVASWTGREVVDPSGDKIGTLDEVYLDDDTGEPEWAAVRTGLFGMRLSFVPLEGSSSEGDRVRVAFDKAKVKDAPNIDQDGTLSQEEEARLYDHYGVGYGEARSESGLPEGREARGTTGVATEGRDTSGPTTDDAMTRSEEELRLSKVRREAGKARLRKYIVTEQVAETVPVQREEARIEREPITEANIGKAMAGPDLSEEEHEIVLTEEEVVAEKEVVPKERVRLSKDVVTDQEQVSEELRKEVIETEGGVSQRPADRPVVS